MGPVIASTPANTSTPKRRAGSDTGANSLSSGIACDTSVVSFAFTIVIVDVIVDVIVASISRHVGAIARPADSSHDPCSLPLAGGDPLPLLMQAARRAKFSTCVGSESPHITCVKRHVGTLVVYVATCARRRRPSSMLHQNATTSVTAPYHGGNLAVFMRGPAAPPGQRSPGATVRRIQRRSAPPATVTPATRTSAHALPTSSCSALLVRLFIPWCDPALHVSHSSSSEFVRFVSGGTHEIVDCRPGPRFG